MVSRKSAEPSPESIARANRQRIAAEEGKQAMADVARQAIAIRQNMARLRALREAGEMDTQTAQAAVEAKVLDQLLIEQIVKAPVKSRAASPSASARGNFPKGCRLPPIRASPLAGPPGRNRQGRALMRLSRYNPVRQISYVGFAVRNRLTELGYATRLMARLLALTGPALARFGLVRDQIFFLGNYSLAIITVSGLFVGDVAVELLRLITRSRGSELVVGYLVYSLLGLCAGYIAQSAIPRVRQSGEAST